MRRFTRAMCNITCKKAVFICLGIVFVTLLASYLLFFNHGPPEDILQANKKPSPRFGGAGEANDMNDVEQQLHGENKKAFEYWTHFIKRNNLVSIGETYDSCDEEERTMVGKTVMIPDRRWGGLKGLTARTFINATLDSELSGGEFFLEVKYNGKSLYNNHWELCTLDEDYGDDRLIFCPFNPGEYSFVKDKKIPLILPKGRYVTKGWITNQDKDIILCGFSDFQL